MFIGINLLRSYCFFLCIIPYHISAVIWPWASFPDVELHFSLRWVAVVARFGAFSGFAILFLTSFLTGTKNRAPWQNLRMPLFLILGSIVFALLDLLRTQTWHWSWDIYPLILSAFFAAKWLVFASYHRAIITALLSMLLLSSAVWRWEPIFKEVPWLGEIILGRCPWDYADWPLLPWVALIWLGLCCGRFFSFFGSNYGDEFWRWRQWELIGWIPVVGFYGYFLPLYFQNPLGDQWACYIFRQEPIVFWSQLAMVIFLLRFSVVPQVQEFLSKIRILRYISSLATHQVFYMAYFFHYILIYGLVGLLYYQFNISTTASVWLIIVGSIFGTELFCRFFVRCIKRRDL